MTTSQQATRHLAKAMGDEVGNFFISIFPDQPSPVVRTGTDGACEPLGRAGHAVAGLCPAGRKVLAALTFCTTPTVCFWRNWLAPASRCVVPFSFCSEISRLPDGRSEPVWFAPHGTRPLAVFAGPCTRWNSMHCAPEGKVTCNLSAFLTTEPNRKSAGRALKPCRSF